MKCSECSRRNHDDNRFCIFCGTALESKLATRETPQSISRQKVLLPPQDIDELISYRDTLRRPAVSIYPAVVASLAIIIVAAGAYYWFWYRDVFEVMAIDYQSTELMDE
ncbi:MAG: zinc ribbon domain-containing protein [Patescibacteria group bacterium]|jgi:hypothetical protein